MKMREFMGTGLVWLSLAAPGIAGAETRVLSPSVVVRTVEGGAPATYVRFDMSPLAEVAPGNIKRALLRTWAGTATNRGSMEVRPVLERWTETSLGASAAPTLAPAIAHVTVNLADGLHDVTIDVTSLVRSWLDGTVTNEGLALLPEARGARVADGEGQSANHPMELEVMLRPDADGGDGSALVNSEPQRRPQGSSARDAAPAAPSYAAAAGATMSPEDWSLAGNEGTSDRNFLGTTDNVPLELRVNGVRALRLEPHAISPNVIGGFPGNTVLAPAHGAVIAGGGGPGEPNEVWMYADNATVSGGMANKANGILSTIGGGTNNTANAGVSTIGGGQENTTIGMSGGVAGTIGGGTGNTVSAGGATVPGGVLNQAGGAGSFAAGSRAKVRNATESADYFGDAGTFVWSDGSVYPGYFTSTGRYQFLVRAAGGFAINTNTPAVGSALTVSGNTTLTGNAGVTGNLGFGAATRQMINLWSTGYGIGVQSSTTYFRSDGGYAWFQGGVHNDAQNNAGGGQRQMRLDANGSLFVRGTVSGGGADFAEMLPAHDDVAPGDVLAIGPDGRLTLSTEPYQDSVAGVYSTKPGLLGGAADGEDLSGKIPLAVSGVIPVKVTDENGPIAPGDSLTSSSTPGHAMKASKVRVGKVAFFPSGVILGKALESLASGEGVIQVLVVLQ